MWIAYDENDFLIGVFSDEHMATGWSQEVEGREVCEVPLIDKTFATMAVEHNRKYEG